MWRFCSWSPARIKLLWVIHSITTFVFGQNDGTVRESFYPCETKWLDKWFMIYSKWCLHVCVIHINLGILNSVRGFFLLIWIFWYVIFNVFFHRVVFCLMWEYQTALFWLVHHWHSQACRSQSPEWWMCLCCSLWFDRSVALTKFWKFSADPLWKMQFASPLSILYTQASLRTKYSPTQLLINLWMGNMNEQSQKHLK